MMINGDKKLILLYLGNQHRFEIVVYIMLKRSIFVYFDEVQKPLT